MLHLFPQKNEDKLKIIFSDLECWQEIAAVNSDNIVNASSEGEYTAIKCHWGRLLKDLFQGLLDKESICNALTLKDEGY